MTKEKEFWVTAKVITTRIVRYAVQVTCREEAIPALYQGEGAELYDTQKVETEVTAIAVEKPDPVDSSIEHRPIKNGDDHMLIRDFIIHCKAGSFIDYDGFGLYATASVRSTFKVCPSDVLAGNINMNYTHVVWYNK